jgi:hypothetical protein
MYTAGSGKDGYVKRFRCGITGSMSQLPQCRAENSHDIHSCKQEGHLRYHEPDEAIRSMRVVPELPRPRREQGEEIMWHCD